jgi:hypothetical protein
MPNGFRGGIRFAFNAFPIIQSLGANMMRNKGILRGLAALFVAMAGTPQAAELPSGRKATPAAAHAKACNINGESGFIVPGSDACVKISGSVAVEVIGASTSSASHSVKRTTP